MPSDRDQGHDSNATTWLPDAPSDGAASDVSSDRAASAGATSAHSGDRSEADTELRGDAPQAETAAFDEHPSERTWDDDASDPSERTWDDDASDPSERTWDDDASDPSERTWDDDASGVVPGSGAGEAIRLERTRPIARAGEVIELGEAVHRYRIGRGADADIPLYTPSAHRDHADLVRESGLWMLRTQGDARVHVDERPVTGDVQLVPGMRLGFGADELCVGSDTSGNGADIDALDPLIASQPSGGRRLALSCAAVFAAVALIWWWFV